MSTRQMGRPTILMLSFLLLPLSLFYAGDPDNKPGESIVIRRDELDAKRREVKGYNLGNLQFDGIKEILDSIKSPEGSISYIRASHRILVVDIPAVHHQVQQVLSEGRGPIVNVTIDVESLNVQAFTQRGINLSWSYADGAEGRAKATIRDGRVKGPDGVTIQPRDQRSTTSRYVKQSIMTMSGRPARLWVTETVLDKAALQRYELIPFQISTERGRVAINEGFRPEVITREIGTSLWVLPTYMQNGLVHIEVFPVISYETENGGEQSFRVEKVRTTVVVKPGSRFFLGGGDRDLRGFMRDLFGSDFSKTGAADNMSMYLTPRVHIMDPARPEAGARSRAKPDHIWRHFPD